MATKKDKLLESAQKNLKKKQLSGAVKDYLKVIEIDPADIRIRQKLAELYVRTNKTAEAYEQYESIAKYFSSNGFHLKAIAIYKLMQRLDPNQVAIYNRLAELNIKQGMVGNAMAEYRSLVELYERNGLIADEIKVLEKMRDLDPGNLDMRVKLAEMLAANERGEEGLAELKLVLQQLRDRKDFDRSLKLYRVFMPYYPDNKHLQIGLSRTFYEKGDYQRGVIILETLLKDKPNDPDLLRQLGRGCSRVGDYPRAVATYQQLLALDPTDLDTRESLVQCEIDIDKPQQALNELEEWKDTFFNAGRIESLKLFYETLKEKLPGNLAVAQTLDSIYEMTGEGNKLLDNYQSDDSIAVGGAEDFSVPAEEVLSDSLLGSVDLDLDSDDGPKFDVLEEEDLDLKFDTIGADAAENNEDETTIELDVKDSFADSSDFDTDFTFDEMDTTSAVTSQSSGDLQADLEEAEFYLQQGLFDDAQQLYRDILVYAPDSQECRRKLEDIDRLRQATEVKTEQPSADESDMAFDLSELDFDLELDPSLVKEGPRQKIFRTDVDEQIAADDMESHYNLGIAYREMGLLDDAISEFEKAQKDPVRFIDCQILKGLCLADKGDFKSAESLLQQALDTPNLGSDQRLNLGYELGLLYEKAQRNSEALISFREVYERDNNYRDVADRITALTTATTKTLSSLDEGSGQKRERISFL